MISQVSAGRRELAALRGRRFVRLDLLGRGPARGALARPPRPTERDAHARSGAPRTGRCEAHEPSSRPRRGLRRHVPASSTARYTRAVAARGCPDEPDYPDVRRRPPRERSGRRRSRAERASDGGSRCRREARPADRRVPGSFARGGRRLGGTRTASRRSRSRAGLQRGGERRRYAGVSHIDVESFDADAVRELLEQHGLEISSLAYYPNNLACRRRCSGKPRTLTCSR